MMCRFFFFFGVGIQYFSNYFKRCCFGSLLIRIKFRHEPGNLIKSVNKIIVKGYIAQGES